MKNISMKRNAYIHILAILIIAVVMTSSGCDLEQYISGTVTWDEELSVGSVIDVVLTDNPDTANNPIASVAVTVSSTTDKVLFILDTSGVPEGTYYIFVGANTDGKEGWDDGFWHGGIEAEPITDLNGVYQLVYQVLLS